MTCLLCRTAGLGPEHAQTPFALSIHRKTGHLSCEKREATAPLVALLLFTIAAGKKLKWFMHWFISNLASSLYAVIAVGHPSTSAEAALEDRADEIRESMLELTLGAEDDRFARVARRVRCATDVQSLWFLRSDLMSVLASRYGEAAAREKLEAVSAMFKGMLPPGLRSRESPLNSSST